MNPVLLLVRDNFEMNKRAIDSIFAQDIPTELTIIDNSNKDETLDWALTNKIRIYPFRPQVGVSKGWNLGLGRIFDKGAEHVLVPNSDTVLAPWFYRRLLNYAQPFITGVAVDVMPTEQVPHCPLTPNPDFSAFLIRRDAWERIGKFDERMKIYCSDCDYHIRGHRLGVPMLKANVPYYHVNSQTLKRADPEDREAIQTQANKDREVFKELYGCLPGTEEYNQLFK